MAGEKMSSLDKDTVLLLNKGKRGLFHLAFGRTAVIIVLLALQVALLFFGFFRLGKYIYYGGSMLLSLVVALMVVNKPGNPAGKITWILLIMLFPVFAALFYLYVETELGHRLAKRRLEEIAAQTASFAPPRPEMLQRLRERDPGFAGLAAYMERSEIGRASCRERV